MTGAASGIGRAIAGRFALGEGCRTCVVDVDRDAALAAAEELNAAGGRAHAFVADLGDGEALKALVAQVLATYGQVDVLVNNAGVGGVFPVDHYPEESWHRIMAVNLTAAFLLSRELLPAMRRRRWGRIVNLSSINGLRAGSGRLAYGTSKTAIIGLTRQLAIDTAHWGVTVNAVAPGTIDTPMLRAMVARGQGSKEMLMRSVPANRFGTPEEIAATVRFLASEEAAYITGQTLAVDGGFSAAGIYVRDLFEPQEAAA